MTHTWMGHTSVGLQEEVKVVHRRNAAVDDGACLRVAKVVRVVCFGGVEAGVVALAADDDSELRAVRLLRGAELLE